MKEFAPFRLDSHNQCLWRTGNAGREERILLTPKAFAVLVYLVEHAGQLVTHEELLDAVWAGSVVEAQAVKRNILEVRSALGDHPKNSLFIETVTKRGYRFIAPVSERAVSSPTAPEIATRSSLVGRDPALNELHDCLQHAARGERQIVFITGEAGIGKTALVDEFRRQLAATALSLRIARGQCVEGFGGKEAYYPMLEALGRLCTGAERDALVQVLAVHAPTWLVQFPALLKREHRETLQREILGATRERMLREIGEALEVITAEHPLLLVFEDLQWVDAATVDLISALARRQGPAKLMLLATYRPSDLEPRGHPLKALKKDLLVHRLCREIVLTAFTEADVQAYVASQAPATSLPEGLSSLLHRHSEGNPLFMVAALEHMTKRGLISRENGGWQLQVPLAQIELAVPDDLRGLIEAQLERLAAEEQNVLELSSIGGASFSPTVIASAADIDPQTFEDVCEELFRRHQIVRWAGTQRFPDGTVSEGYEFVHAVYRQVLYDRQTPGRRARLHRRIGERLEALYSQQMDETAAELAYHFEAAADWPRAVEYLRRAADIAGRRYAHPQADSLLQRALELVRNLPEAQRAPKEIDLLAKLASSRAAALDMRAIDTYEALAARAADYGLIDEQVRALVDLSFLLSWVSAERCLESLRRALCLSAHQDPIARARTRASCAFRRLWGVGWNAQDVQEYRQALAETPKTDDQPALAMHLIEDSFIHWMSTDYREAHRLALESRAKLFERSGDNPYLSIAYGLSQGIVPFSLFFRGEWGEALRELAVEIALAERNRDPYWTSQSQTIRAWVHLLALDFKGALAICDSALPVLRDPAPRTAEFPLPSDGTLRMALICAGSAAVALGDHGRAVEHLSAASRDMDRETALFDWYWRMPLCAGFTELWLAKGDLVRARFHAQRFLDSTLATEERTWQGLAWEVNARLAAAERDHARARDCITRALSTMQGFEVPVAAWPVYATAADIDEQAGDMESAAVHRELSRATIRQLADSLPAEEPLRQIFLVAAPAVAKILNRQS
jgi:DNA-binding winged helix-turn-helix (wHTH) protein/tetratricopeptide (TPR) repeat protein